MDCPVCKDAMVVLELHDVEVDYCFGCGGIWLDAGELELLIDDPERSQKLMESFKKDDRCKEAKRKCPICDKKMDKVIVESDKLGLLIDKCSKNHGIWFDAGELQDIMSCAQLDSDNKIRRLLAEMFAGEQLRKNSEN